MTSTNLKLIGEDLEDRAVKTRNCPTHGDYEAMFSVAENRWSGCQACLKLERDKAERDEAMARRVAIQQERSGIPEKYRAATFANFSPTRKNKVGEDERIESLDSKLKKAKRYSQYVNEGNHRGSNLILVGLSGTGKTHIAMAIAHEAIKNRKTVKYVTAEDIMLSIRATYSNKSNKTELEAIHDFASPDLLIIDEIDKLKNPETHDANNELKQVFTIVNKRYSNEKPIVLIGNVPTEQLRNRLGEPTWERLKERSNKLVFTESSYRVQFENLDLEAQ
jgi:DNA replication protein DnaC